jgi:hypothetical protein
VSSLIADCAKRFPGGRLIYDSIPAWYRNLTLKGLKLSNRYTAPRMPLGLSVSESARFARAIPGIAAVTDIPLRLGRPRWLAHIASRLTTLPALRNLRPAITQLDFQP